MLLTGLATYSINMHWCLARHHCTVSCCSVLSSYSPFRVLSWWPCSYEMLLRRLLTWPGSPAILQVHTIQPFPRSPSFAHSAEDAINVLGQYYGVPYVSARNALWLKQQFPQPNNAMNMDIRVSSSLLN